MKVFENYGKHMDKKVKKGELKQRAANNTITKIARNLMGTEMSALQRPPQSAFVLKRSTCTLDYVEIPLPERKNITDSDISHFIIMSFKRLLIPLHSFLSLIHESFLYSISNESMK